MFDKVIALQIIADQWIMLTLTMFTNIEITGSKELANLVENYRHEWPPKSTLIPKVDLDLGMWTLIEKLFEPVWENQQVPLAYRT